MYWVDQSTRNSVVRLRRGGSLDDVALWALLTCLMLQVLDKPLVRGHKPTNLNSILEWPNEK